ncbi:hypothetical protein LX64_00501 [Chitinophaga skermanii]|uniref:Sulfite exporter TauE/SafE n=1 Tax=Chitinophaga skermanii TaxID=331697 RepID=A0A327R5C0_9BACT|nr:hypothetical protein [Chitinophaga skermanii]RAJ10894.1 hypothetical protein LX64_00501 [Chitinophaga skermanii]
MNPELVTLLLTAITISCLHTVTGPDHYVPFIALSKSRNWNVYKTIGWTVVCGIGHVGSSIVLGLIGIYFGWQLSKLTGIEEVRGGLAAWALFIFGCLYLLYGIIQAIRNRAHKHFDVTAGGDIYVYKHQHGTAVAPRNRVKVTPWIMFIIFVLGPCEPLIPLLMFPAATHAPMNIVLLIGVFLFFTLVVMVGMVLLGYFGFSLLQKSALEKYMHVIGGASITICGLGMLAFGW